MMATSDETTISLLVELIQQFFSHQITNNSALSDAAKESLQVATECIEQAYSIQRKPGSNELLEIYKSHQNRPTHGFGGAAGANFDLSALASAFAGSNPTQLLQNLATTFLSQNQGSPAGSESTTTNSTTAPPPSQQSSTTTPTATTATTTRTPKVRKQATAAEKIAAESFKNQGNDLMKQDKFKEAYDCYSQAIDIDDNNAIYYSNRAAASSKLGNLQATIDDCQEAIEIDPSYGKAYGRLGYAYASMGECQKAKEAYQKAVELDPENESHRNNLRSAEEQLQEAQARASSTGAGNLGAGADATGAGGPFGGGANPMADMLRSVIGNPEVMSMAMRSLQDPRLQSMFGLGGQPGGGGGGGGGASGGGNARQ